MYKIDEIKMLRLGQRDENLARSLPFDCSDWMEQYPEASIHILFRRPGESTITPMSTTLEGTTLTWLIHDFEVGKTGVGNAEFRAVDTAGLRRKSRIIPCSIEDTLLGDDETVLYTQDQVDETLAHISEAAQAAQAAKASEEAAALSAQEAEESAASADTAADAATSARDAAHAAQTAAETAQHQAEAAQSGVHADAEAAEQAKVAAQAAQASAQGAASQASADRTAAESARADAEAAAEHAESVTEGIDQAGADQVAAVNAAGQAQVSAVNQAGTTQVGNVNTAGTTQVNAVQAKGTQVIASIPADYSALSGDVTNLKSAINVINNDIYYATESADWVNGVIQNAAGNPRFMSDTTRLTTKHAYSISKGTSINLSVPTGYKHRILFTTSYVGELAYNQWLGIVQGYTDDTGHWHSEMNRTIIAPECAGFIVSIAKSDDSTISPTDIPDVTISTASIKTVTLEEASTMFTNIGDFVRNLGYYKTENIIKTEFVNGYWGVNAGTLYPAANRCAHEKINIVGEKIHLEIPATMKGRLNFFKANGSVISSSSSANWTTGAFDYAIPEEAVSVGISVAFTNDATISPSDCTEVKAWTFWGNDADDTGSFIGKKLSILGDSISTFAGAGAESAGDGHTIADGTYTYAGNHCRYPTSYLSNVDDTYWMKLINALGMVLGVNDSWAGSRVSYDAGEGSDYGANIYIASPTRIGHLDDNGTPDIILVNAGTNDIGLNVPIGTFNTENPKDYTDAEIASLPTTTFADAYRALLIRLQKAYPLAKIVCMLPDYTTTYYNPTKADSYLEVIKEACDFFGVPWVDMRTVGVTMYNTGTYLGDGIHPNVAGMNLLYKKLRKFFEYTL